MRINRCNTILLLIVFGILLIIFNNNFLINYEYVNSVRKVLLISLVGLTISDIFTKKERLEIGNLRYIIVFLFSVVTFFVILRTGSFFGPITILLAFGMINAIIVKNK